jgi:hypothetical protein
MLVATAVAIITCLAVANATQTITTPNAAFISYNLAAGGNSAAITPATSRSVLVMGCCTSPLNDLGVGQVSLLHIHNDNIGNTYILWAGYESWNGAGVWPSPGASLTQQGFTSCSSTSIIRCKSRPPAQIPSKSTTAVLVLGPAMWPSSGKHARRNKTTKRTNPKEIQTK